MPGGRPREIKIGSRSGALVIEKIDGRDDRGRLLIVCRCDCGRPRVVNNVTFRERRGCVACMGAGGGNLKHGGAKRGSRNPLYSAFRAMHSRCYSVNTRNYRWYGAKGIKVCSEWHDFVVFREWAMANGYQPGLTLDREFEDRDYCPSNCSYVTQSENSRRMRTKYRMTLKSTWLYNEPTFGDY